MPTETKNTNREGVAQRQTFLRRPMAELAFGQNHAGEEGAERDRDAEQLGCAEGDAKRDRQDAEAEQFAGTGVGDAVHPE